MMMQRGATKQNEMSVLARLGRKWRALAVVSIHNDSCAYINDQATGFKVAAAISTTYPERALRLTNCLRARYAASTGLNFHAGSVTNDMTNYHSFVEIINNTPAAIIEVGALVAQCLAPSAGQLQGNVRSRRPEFHRAADPDILLPRDSVEMPDGVHRNARSSRDGGGQS